MRTNRYPSFAEEIPGDVFERLERRRFAERLADLAQKDNTSQLVNELRLLALSMKPSKSPQNSRVDAAFEMMLRICPSVEQHRTQIEKAIFYLKQTEADLKD